MSLSISPGLRQSFSGSETSTDVSVSSTENINLSTSQRQEPQGEENQGQVHHVQEFSDSTDFSILERLAKEKQQQQKPAYFGTVPHPTDNKGYLNSGGTPYTWGPMPNNQLAPSMGRHQHVTTCSTSQQYSSGEEISSYNLPVIASNSNSYWTSGEHLSGSGCHLGGSGHLGSSGQFSSGNSGEQLQSSGSATSLQSSYFTTLPPPPQYPVQGMYENNSERTKMRRSYETVDRTDTGDNSNIKQCHSYSDLSGYLNAHYIMSQQQQQQMHGSNSPNSQSDDQR